MRAGVIYVRHCRKEPFVSREFHGDGEVCLACGHPMGSDDETILVPLGPGDGAEERIRAAAGRWYAAVAVMVHRACGLGEAS